jgi:hypothetical protein
MHRERLNTQLAEIEKHIALGREHITRQQRLIDELERSRRPTNHERSLLTTFRALLKQHEQQRERLRRELEALDGGGGQSTTVHR